MADLRRLLFILSVLVMTESMEKSSMYMKNSGSEDMESSASGYDYHLRSGQPFSYKSVQSDSPKFYNFAYPPINYEQYKHHNLPLPEIPLSPSYVPSYYDMLVNSYGIPVSYASYVEPLKGNDVLMGSVKTGHMAAISKASDYGIPINSYEIPTSYALYAKPVKGYDTILNSIKTGVKDAPNHGLNSENFAKNSGLRYEDAEKAIHGEKGEREYLTLDEFEKGLKGEKEKNQHKGFYNEAGGNKAEFLEVVDHYGSKKQASKGSQGETFSDKKDNKRGSKTTGYHKILHKDDYKKDHSFYDKADKSGYFRRYGDYEAKQDANNGVFKKGQHHDSGYKGAAFGAKGYSDKGKYIDEDKAYKAAAGNQKYFQNRADYANTARKETGKELGFSGDNEFGHTRD